LIINFLFPTWAKAGAIQAIARRKNGQPSSVGIGFKNGILSLLPLIEYHILVKTFSFFSIIFEMSLVYRNFGETFIFKMLFPVLIIFLFVSLLLTLLFTFADFFIVVDGEGVFDSMKKSGKLVIQHLKHTFLITMLMVLIGLRIVVQAIIVFLIPSLIILISGYIATISLPITGFITGLILGVITLLLAAYVNGIVDVFSYTVWTYTFLELSSEEEVSAREVFTDDIGENKASNSHHKNL